MEQVVTIGVAAIGAVGSIVAAWVAHRVARNTKPISNGFAADTFRRLDRIEELILDHIESHANADVRRKR